MTWTIIMILCLASAGVGVGGTLGIQNIGKRRSTDVSTTVEAAMKPDATDAEARLAVASMPAVNIAVEAATKPDASNRTMALAAYALCLSAAQGKTEGSAAFGCQDRGRILDASLSPE